MTVDSKMKAAIQKARNRAGITSWDQLAEKTGMRKATILDVINGKVDPHLSTLRRMAEGCNCSVGEMLGREK